jgi:hypothetical protein
MKKLNQTKYGEEGNCFAACIASLFEVEIADIPFLADYKNWDEYLSVLNSILRNKFEVILLHGEFKDWEDYLKENYIDSYYIVSGDSNKGLEHAVIYKNGELFHNPNNLGTEIINIKHVYVFLKLHL